MCVSLPILQEIELPFTEDIEDEMVNLIEEFFLGGLGCPKREVDEIECGWVLALWIIEVVIQVIFNA